MNTKLIKLDDNTLVEVEIVSSEAQQISGGLAKSVKSNLSKIVPVLTSACKPIADAWNTLSVDFKVDQAELELGINFTTEGNVYIAKSKLDANLKITLTLKSNKD